MKAKKLKSPLPPGGWKQAKPNEYTSNCTLPAGISPKLASLLRDCGDRFREVINSEDRIWECTEGAMMGKVVVVQRRKDGKGRIAFFSPRAKWKKVKVKLGEKW